MNAFRGPAVRRTARSAALAAAVALAAALALAACSGGGERPGARAAAAGGPGDGRASWYQLVSGEFKKIPGPSSSAAVTRLPWTVQSRVADAAFLGPTLYLAVNGFGLSALDLSKGAPSFGSSYDRLIFPHRTLTTLVPRAGGLTVHLYFNALLNTVKPVELPLQGISLVSFLPASSEFAFLIPPFQKNNPDWEAVGFLPTGTDDFLFEWKQTDAEQTRFAYTRYRPADGGESLITRAEYLGAFSLTAGSAVALTPSHAALFSLCRKEMPSLPADAAVHFVLRSRADPVKRVFRSGEGVSSLVVVPVFEEGGGTLALLPGGRLIRVSPSGDDSTLMLPALPAGFRYTDVVKTGGTLVLPWEEQSFTDVGAAGLLLYALD